MNKLVSGTLRSILSFVLLPPLAIASTMVSNKPSTFESLPRPVLKVRATKVPSRVVTGEPFTGDANIVHNWSDARAKRERSRIKRARKDGQR